MEVAAVVPFCCCCHGVATRHHLFQPRTEPPPEEPPPHVKRRRRCPLLLFLNSRPAAQGRDLPPSPFLVRMPSLVVANHHCPRSSLQPCKSSLQLLQPALPAKGVANRDSPSSLVADPSLPCDLILEQAGTLGALLGVEVSLLQHHLPPLRPPLSLLQFHQIPKSLTSISSFPNFPASDFTLAPSAYWFVCVLVDDIGELERRLEDVGYAVLAIRIHCTGTGCYTSDEVIRSAYHGMTYDKIKVSGFKVSNASGVLGRCFIEVENGFKGESFPVKIAYATICKELIFCMPIQWSYSTLSSLGSALIHSVYDPIFIHCTLQLSHSSFQD
ncbi:hypothetical protein RIF29_19320 [Crotalaria pallida]|uniref:Uncharacterized protein n=1 Tax=Crotalaria pallida TaxID=3830 RepID=A0AAN9F3M3_CROPI